MTVLILDVTVMRRRCHAACHARRGRRWVLVDRSIAVVVDPVAHFFGRGIDARIVVVAVDGAAVPALRRETVLVGIGAARRGEIAEAVVIRGRAVEAEGDGGGRLARRGIERQQRVEDARGREQGSSPLVVESDAGLRAQGLVRGIELRRDGRGHVEAVQMRTLRITLGPQEPVARCVLRDVTSEHIQDRARDAAKTHLPDHGRVERCYLNAAELVGGLVDGIEDTTREGEAHDVICAKAHGVSRNNRANAPETKGAGRNLQDVAGPRCRRVEKVVARGGQCGNLAEFGRQGAEGCELSRRAIDTEDQRLGNDRTVRRAIHQKDRRGAHRPRTCDREQQRESCDGGSTAHDAEQV